MKASLYSVFALIALLAIGHPPLALAGPVVDVFAGAVRPVNLAVPPILAAGGAEFPAAQQKELIDAIRWRLNFHGTFQTMPEAIYPERNKLDLEKPDIGFWKSSGAELLCQIGAAIEGEKARLEVRVWDASQGRQIFSTRFSGNAAATLALADAVANAVLEKMAQIPPIFGDTIYFQYQKPGKRWRELYTTRLGRAELDPVTAGQRFVIKPRLDPAGRKLVFVGYRNHTPSLYTYDLRSQKEAAWPKPGASVVGASWRDSGTLFVAAGIGGDPDIYSFETVGGRWTPVVSRGGIDVSAEISPDGKRIVFVSNREGNPHVYVKDLSTGSESRLTVDGQYNASPRWSPDGKWIVFTRREGGRFSIFAVTSDGGELRRLTDDRSTDEDPAWTRDGRTVVFSSERAGGAELFAVDLYTGKLNKLTAFGGQSRMPDIERGGR